MPRTRNAVGVLVLKQIYSRLGHNYMGITIPTGIVDALGWEPGMLLQYYPTKDFGMKLIAVAEAIKDKEFEPRLTAETKPVRGPRPGSLAERQVEVDTKVSKMLDRLSGVAAERARERQKQPTLKSKPRSPKPKPRRR